MIWMLHDMYSRHLLTKLVAMQIQLHYIGRYSMAEQETGITSSLLSTEKLCLVKKQC